MAGSNKVDRKQAVVGKAGWQWGTHGGVSRRPVERTGNKWNIIRARLTHQDEEEAFLDNAGDVIAARGPVPFCPHHQVLGGPTDRKRSPHSRVVRLWWGIRAMQVLLTLAGQMSPPLLAAK